MNGVSGRSPLDGIVFVLDRPKDAANVGAVVRLLGNFGLSRLRLVEPAAFDEQRVLRYARRGEAVAARVERFPSLELALADCTLVLGTTRRERALERPVLSPRQLPGVLIPVLRPAATMDTVLPGPAAVLFGPEDFGLSNQALDRCHAIVTVPAAPDDSSLNLAQAAAIVAYEIFIALGSDAPEARAWAAPALQALENMAPSSDVDALFDSVARLLAALHNPPIEGRTKSALSRLRAFFLRAAPRADETRLLATIFEHAARELDRRRSR